MTDYCPGYGQFAGRCTEPEGKWSTNLCPDCEQLRRETVRDELETFRELLQKRRNRETKA
jgi:hypothetical protein